MRLPHLRRPRLTLMSYGELLSVLERQFSKTLKLAKESGLQLLLLVSGVSRLPVFAMRAVVLP